MRSASRSLTFSTLSAMRMLTSPSTLPANSPVARIQSDLNQPITHQEVLRHALGQPLLDLLDLVGDEDVDLAVHLAGEFPRGAHPVRSEPAHNSSGSLAPCARPAAP